jgi:ubiquinone/menaquinone biosynthesis C-methylase UbiE
MKNESLPSVQTIANWYNQRYLNGQEQAFGRPFQESVLRLNYLPSVANLRVLDVACGQGYFLKAVQDAGGQAFGVDIAIEAAKIAREQASAGQVSTASGEHLPFPDHSFDILTCWGSLEHHRHMEQALSEFVRVLKPGSRLVLRVPNREFWVYLVLRKFLRRPVGTEQQDIVEKLLSLDEWRTLFEQAGISVDSISADKWFLQHPLSDMPNIPEKLKLLGRRLALAVAPLRYTYVFDFVCHVRISEG